MEHIPGPDFPTGGVICGRTGIMEGVPDRPQHRRRSARRPTIDEDKKKTADHRPRDPLPAIARSASSRRSPPSPNDGKIAGISAVQRRKSDLNEPVRLVDRAEARRRSRTWSSTSSTSSRRCRSRSQSVIFLALVDGKPRVLNLKEMLEEFLRHRVTVIRRRTQFLLARARKRKHTVQGLLLAHANIDEVIRVIRASKTQPEAKQALMEIKTPGAMLKRALGDDGFAQFQDERGVAEEYSLTPVQADAILKMTLGQLVNLEQEKLADEHAELLTEIAEYLDILGDEARIYAIIREDMEELIKKPRRRAAHRDQRRRDRRRRPRRPDRRRDDGRLDQPSGLHQADRGERLPGAATRRQGHQGRQDRRRRPDRAPVRHQHARLPDVLHEQGEGLLAEGLQPARAGARREGPRGREPA